MTNLPAPPHVFRNGGYQAAALLLLTVAMVSDGNAQRAQPPASASAGEIPLWRTSGTPTFDSQRAAIGAASAPLLSVSGLTRLGDGTVVVADAGAFNLKFYAPDGRLLRVVGRDGAGPGEYRTPRMLGTCGQKFLHVYDGNLARITVLDLTGRMVDSWRIGISQSNQQPPMDVVCGRGGSAALLGWSPDLEGQITKPTAHRGRIRLNLRRMTRDASTAELGLVMGPDRQRWMTSDGPRPLGKSTFVAVGSDRLFIGTGDSSSIAVQSLTGQKLASVRLPYRRIRIDDDYLRDFVDRVIELNPNRSPAELKQRYADIEFPEFFPSHGPLLVDGGGNLWVERYRLPGETASRWTIFNGLGVAIAAIDLPPLFRLLEAGTEDIVGTWEDADGVLHVRVYQLLR